MDHETRGNHTWIGGTEFGKRVTIAGTPPETVTTSNLLTI